MRVLRHLEERLQKGKLHMTLVDPEKQPAEVASDVASSMEDMGTDAIMVGGSTGVTQENLDTTVRGIKSVVEVPVILFPASAQTISEHADAI